MHFSKFFLIASAAICSAAPADVSAVNANVADSTLVTFSGTKGTNGILVAGNAPSAQTDQRLQKKQALLPVVAITAVAAGAKIAEIAIEIGADTLKNLKDWNKVRETFTKNVVSELWKRNPNYNKYHAAACYNKGYRLKNPKGITAFASAKLSLGQLRTDYDCMLMDAPNAFWTNSEGGYINLAFRYDRRCTFDKKSGDLTCN